ncbi:MAG: MCE family protein [Solirubrobacterales bacterium]|nr:MCE family protein [Solirubrobacterales bacterium]
MTARRIAVGVLLAAGVAIFLVARGGDDRYMTRVVLEDSGGLRKGSNVRVDGAPAGTVAKLELDGQDRAIAELRLDEGAAPVGQNAKALVQADGFFGERYIELTRGDVGRPAGDGATIPESRTAVSVRVDDVIDTLDVDTRSALQVFLAEQGSALVGRGQDLRDVLDALPPGLAQTGELLDAFSRDNEALGRLVERSDRVVASVARERKQLGRLVAGAGDTLDVLASRRAGLRETVQRAPATLRSARSTLVSLDRAADPLIPAAQGLRRTAPFLKRTLDELPSFTDDAVPALKSVAKVAPKLQKLADEGTAPVQRIRPLALELASYSDSALGPFTDTLAKGTPDLFGVMEGWARSTQGRDASSRIFRFGATTGSDIFAALLQTPAERKRRARRGDEPPALRPEPTPNASPQTPAAPVPAATPEKPRGLVPQLTDILPGDLGKTVDALLPKPTQRPASPSATGDLLDYLLGP